MIMLQIFDSGKCNIGMETGYVYTAILLIMNYSDDCVHLMVDYPCVGAREAKWVCTTWMPPAEMLLIHSSTNSQSKEVQPDVKMGN